MFQSISFEALTVLIAPLMALWVIYIRNRRGDYSKEKIEAARYAALHPDFEKMGPLSRWWWHSYIREVFVVRSQGRRWRSLIPWVGVAFSGIFFFFFFMMVYLAWLESPVPLEQLTERRGTFLFYTARRRLSNQVTFLMEDGSTKSFNNGCMNSEGIERFTQQRVRFWTGRAILLRGWVEECVFVYPDDGTAPLKAYEEDSQKQKEFQGRMLDNFFFSSKFLFFFLGLIWLINIRPLKTED